MKVAIALFLAAASVSAVADTQAVFTLPSGVNVKITEAPFDKNMFKVSGCTAAGTTSLINGHFPWGVAFGLPKTYLKSLVVSYQNQSYSLEISDMYDAWGGRPLEYKGAIRYFGGRCANPKNCQFRGLFPTRPVRTSLSGVLLMGCRFGPY